jgi:hypothetical protein
VSCSREFVCALRERYSQAITTVERRRLVTSSLGSTVIGHATRDQAHAVPVHAGCRLIGIWSSVTLRE